jgi:hypothetical protein
MVCLVAFVSAELAHAVRSVQLDHANLERGDIALEDSSYAAETHTRS